MWLWLLINLLAVQAILEWSDLAEGFFTPGSEGEYSLGDWFIGGMPNFNDRFVGYIDDARVYSAALTDSEISKIYNNHSGIWALLEILLLL